MHDSDYYLALSVSEFILRGIFPSGIWHSCKNSAVAQFFLGIAHIFPFAGKSVRDFVFSGVLAVERCKFQHDVGFSFVCFSFCLASPSEPSVTPSYIRKTPATFERHQQIKCRARGGKVSSIYSYNAKQLFLV